jgi:hypothetical protein
MAGRFHQRGISMFTLLFFLVVIGGVGMMVMQAFPSMLEYQAALKAVNKAKDEGTVAAIRASFDRAAQIDDINSITGKDLEITKNGDQVLVSFAYQKEFHMFGPAWLTLKYQGTSRPGR